MNSKYIGFAGLLAGLPFAGLVVMLNSCENGKGGQPNVILVITDDQGYGDLACHGNSIIQTPHLDRLYEESVRLTDFHVGTTCAPTRAALMTGRYSNRSGVWHTIGGCSMLNEKETTMADIFSANGYSTGLFGKWHLGDNYPYRPHDRGFEEAFYHGGGGIVQSPDYWLNDYFDDIFFRNGVREKTEGYCTDVWFREALSFISGNKDKPFFCYISPNAPHSPFNVPEEYYMLYKDAELSESQKRFYGMITNIDDNIGLLVEKLNEWGLAENTILIFMTDNGTSAGYASNNVTGRLTGFNAGMRGTKGMVYEGGHRVPFFIRYPKKLSFNRDIDMLTSHLDVLPTLAELCGLNYEHGLKPDGKSIAGVLMGKESPDSTRVLITDTQRVQWPVKGRNSCVMQGKWRLINSYELYNIKDDPGQINDLASVLPEKVEELSSFYERWWEDIEKEFEYSYIKIGCIEENPVIITAHDQHPETGISAWNHNLVRSMGAVSTGYYCIEVCDEGRYQIELSRWPFESKLIFSEGVPSLKDTSFKDGMPEGSGKEFKTAFFQIIDGTGFSRAVDNSLRSAFIVGNLPSGKHKMRFFYTDAAGDTTGAYFIRITKYDEFKDSVRNSAFCESLSPAGRILEMEDFTVWCNSPIYGPDGKVHVFFSKIPRGGSWLVNSEIAHAVADSAEGPYKVLGTVLTGRGGKHWDAHTIHNPTIHKVGDKYALFYIGNNLDDVKKYGLHLAGTQKIGLAIADNINGPYNRVGEDGLILDISNDKDDWDSYITCNPFFLQHPDGSFWLYYKSWDRYNDNLRKMGVAFSKNLEGPYTKYEGNPIIDFSLFGKQVEDAYVWYEKGKFHLIMRDMGLISEYTGIYLSSHDGLNWSGLKRAYQNSEFYFPGLGVKRFERPQVLSKDGKSEYLFMALQGGKYGLPSGAVLRIGEWE